MAESGISLGSSIPSPSMHVGKTGGWKPWKAKNKKTGEQGISSYILTCKREYSVNAKKQISVLVLIGRTVTWVTTNKLKPHWNVCMPFHRVNTKNTGDDWFVQLGFRDSLIVSIGIVFLERKKKTFSILTNVFCLFNRYCWVVVRPIAVSLLFFFFTKKIIPSKTIRDIYFWMYIKFAIRKKS